MTITYMHLELTIAYYIGSTWRCGWVGGWVNQAYSRLSTTHGHITDCKLDSVVEMRVGNLVETVAKTSMRTAAHQTFEQEMI